VLDLNADSAAAVSRMGSAAADTLALQTQFDHTHLGAKGAAFFARMVSRELEDAVPALPMRPELTAARAQQYSYAKVLGDWDPLSDPLAKGAPLTPDFVVDSQGGPGAFATIQAAVTRAAAAKGGRRIHILVKPGTYRELVHVPASAAPITIYGEGPDARAVRIEGNLDAMLAGTAGSATAWIQGAGFQAKNVTFANTFNGWSQAVALLADDADRVQFENVRFEGFQDTLYLKSSPPARARIFLHKSYVEGDVDFIFGDAAAYFLESEVRSLGTRTYSYALAPSTLRSSPFGFVFQRCVFTHDGSAQALAAKFKLARQWFRGGDAEAVGKVAILESRIGAHIDKARPWADWGIGTPRYRRVQYDSDDGEAFLAEYRNVDN
jgi:pectin methylesterase-like acyl-CoA thioesterase